MVKAVKKKTAKKKEPIPLFPWNWVTEAVGYQKNPTLFKDKSGSSKKLKLRYRKKLELPEIEMPLDRTESTLSLFRKFSRKGADPNYLDAILWYYCDPQRLFKFKTVFKTHLQKAIRLHKSLKDAPTIFSKIVDADLLDDINSLIIRLDRYLGNLVETDTRTVTFYLPEEMSPSNTIGRPTNPNMNLIILLSHRHLHHFLKSSGKYEGTFTLLASFLRSCFPETFKSLNRNTLKARILHHKGNKELLRACRKFEDEFKNLSPRLIKKSRNRNVHDDICSSFFFPAR